MRHRNRNFINGKQVNKMTLSEALPEFKLMDILECVSELGWKTEFSAEQFEHKGTGENYLLMWHKSKNRWLARSGTRLVSRMPQRQQDMLGLLPESDHCAT
jgi:hypothetical protein